MATRGPRKTSRQPSEPWQKLGKLGELWVVLDTTALYGRRLVKGDPLLRLIFNARAALGYKVAIPEIVLRERLRQEREALTDAWREARSAAKYYARSAGIPLSKFFVEPHFAEFLDIHLQKADKALRQNADKVLPLPKASVDEIVDRDIGARKPFKRDGTGFRDYLIWRAILELRASGAARILFVTENKKDFATQNALHPDLAQDLASDPDGAAAIQLVRNPYQLIKDVLQKSFDVHDDVVGKPLSEALEPPLVEEARALANSLIRELKDLEPIINADDSGVPFDADVVGLLSSRFDVVRLMATVPNGDHLVDASFLFTLVLDLPEMTNKGPVSDLFEGDFRCRIRFLANPTKKRVYGLEVSDMEFVDENELGQESRWWLEARADAAEEARELAKFSQRPSGANKSSP